MVVNIYVANLSGETTEDDLREAFRAFGEVESVKLIKDRVSGESRGYGFVLMPSKNEAESAINEMNGKDLKGQAIKVEEGRTKTRVRSGGSRRTGFGGRDGRGRPNGFGGNRGGGRGGGFSRGGRGR
jgi:RNA recognition motif-containing protein